MYRHGDKFSDCYNDEYVAEGQIPEVGDVIYYNGKPLSPGIVQRLYVMVSPSKPGVATMSQTRVTWQKKDGSVRTDPALRLKSLDDLIEDHLSKAEGHKKRAEELRQRVTS